MANSVDAALLVLDRAMVEEGHAQLRLEAAQLVEQINGLVDSRLADNNLKEGDHFKFEIRMFTFQLTSFFFFRVASMNSSAPLMASLMLRVSRAFSGLSFLAASWHCFSKLITSAVIFSRSSFSDATSPRYASRCPSAATGV